MGRFSGTPNHRDANDLISREELITAIDDQSAEQTIELRERYTEPLYRDIGVSDTQFAYLERYRRLLAANSSLSWGEKNLQHRLQQAFPKGKAETRQQKGIRELTTDAVIFAGPSCGGKTSHSRRFAANSGLPLIDGDTLHPLGNVLTMRDGNSLVPEQRGPWLDAIVAVSRHIRQETGYPPVVVCSAITQRVRRKLADIGTLAYIDCLASTEDSIVRASERDHPYIRAANNKRFIQNQYETHQREIAGTGANDHDYILTVDTRQSKSEVESAIDEFAQQQILPR